MPFDPWFLFVGWATVLVISLGKGAFGGGLAMLGVPLMSLVMSPVEAAILIAPLVALPLLIPVVIAATRATTPLLLETGAEAVPLRWAGTLGLYDMVFALLAYAVFDFLLED